MPKGYVKRATYERVRRELCKAKIFAAKLEKELCEYRRKLDSVKVQLQIHSSALNENAQELEGLEKKNETLERTITVMAIALHCDKEEDQ